MTEDQRAMLDSIRSSALSIAQAADAMLRMPAADALTRTCPPHVGTQTDLTTMGGPRQLYCSTCQQTYEPERKED